MADLRFSLTFDAKMEIGLAKLSLQLFLNILNSLQLPLNFSKGIQKNIDDLTKSILNFEVLSSKKVSSKTDISTLERNAKKINDLFETIKLLFRDLGKISGKDLDKLFPESVAKNIEKANKAMAEYTKATSNSGAEVTKTNKNIINLTATLTAKTNALTAANNKLAASQKSLTEAGKKIIDKTGILDIEEARKRLLELILQRTEYLNRVLEGKDKLGRRHTYPSGTEGRTKQEIADLKSLEAEYVKYDAIIKQNENTVKSAERELANAAKRLTELRDILKLFETQNELESGAALKKLFEDLEKIDGIDLTGLTHTFENAEKVILNLSLTTRDKLLSAFQTAVNESKNVESGLGGIENRLDAAKEQLKEFDSRAREVDGLKSRIQYFFGLNNAIQLVRRTIRSAYQTISELDKAMTETAVVTNFSVSDMWSQLPEYTKNANALGVATLDAYKAATLYYQQGLKTNEVTALYNETLKMARIAGLDAAEATDRMTNALRGFNMELTETNALRVDDVYSQLAAITASNVDEISTAMTKVASLAHNANMEFENTAAFLAQIIETTRESAETAGTALKTVVARFSEVKKLYSENEISGTDEEGEVIDVNKVAIALRTAGIDLNKYFLGEVGLDDIFIELASKWDSLTKILQRYIATQAAGSRQQSRFIALMSDYARTQELTAAAYNSTGASAKLFEKTLESLQSKLARLKNAWNEFTMSITNSSLVKAGVDILTTLLNIVNKLTSGFGSLTEGVGGFINALAKISLSAGLLKVFSVLAAGGMASLSNIIKPGGTTPKAAMITRGLGSDVEEGMTKTEIQKYSTGKLLGQAFISPFGGIKNTFKNLGLTSLAQNIWKGSKGLGRSIISNTGIIGNVGSAITSAFSNIGVSSGVTAGILGLTTAIGGLTTAGIAAYAIIKKIYDASPEGLLKAAEKLQDSITQTYNDLQSTNSSLKSIISSYHDAQEQLKLTTYGTQEWAEALNNVNNSVLNIIEKFPTLAQYATTGANGVMSLSEEGLKAYLTELSNRITDQAFMKMAAGGNVALKKAATLTGEAAAQQERLAIAQYRAALSSKYGELFSLETINALSESFDYSKWAKEAAKENDVGKFLGEDFWVSRKEWRKRYLETTGSEAPDSWSSNDIASALARFDALPKIEEQLESLANFVKDNDSASNLEKIIAGDKNAKIDLVLKYDLTEYGFGTYESNLTEYLKNRNKKPTLTEEDYATNPDYANYMASLLLNSAVFLSTTDKQWFLDYLTQEGINVNDYLRVNNFKNIDEAVEKFFEQAENIQAQNEATTENITKLFNKTFTTGRASEIQSAFTSFLGEAGENVSAEQYYKIGEVFKLLGIAGISGEGLGIFSGLAETLGGDEEKLKTFYSILSSLDVTDANSIEKTFLLLEELGVDFSKFGGSADKASLELIRLAHAVKEVDLDKLKKDVASTSTFLKGLSEREETNRTFSEEEFNLFIKGTEAELNFIYTGIEGQEYVYYGDLLSTIINILSEQLAEQISTNKELIDRDINIGEAIENGPYKVLESIISSKGVVTDLLKTILDATLGQYGISFDGLSYEQAVEKAQELLGLTGDLLELNKLKQANYEDYVVAPLYIRDSVSEIYGNKDLDEGAREKILNAQLQTNEVAAQVHDHILETLKKLGVEESKALKIARDLSLVYAEQAKKIDKINDAINKNKDALKAGNKAAITNVAKQLASVYGLKNQNALENLVDLHKEDLLLMSEDDEAYYKVLSALHEQWMLENALSYNLLTDVSNQWLQNLNNKIESVPPLEIYTNIETSAFDQSLLNMFKEVGDFENYIATLGWAVDWEAYGDAEHTMATLLQGEMHLVRVSGGGSKGFTGGGSSGGGGGNNAWKNELDRLYNLLEDIEENQRIQQRLQEDYNRLLKDPNVTAKDLVDNVMAQVTAKTIEAEQLGARYVERERDLWNYLSENKDYSEYVRYNYDDKTVEIAWNLINELKQEDKEKYDKIVEIVNHAKELESDRDTANDRIAEIKDELLELLDIWEESYIQFEDRVRLALTQSYQKVIDNYSELSSTLSQTASDILQSLLDEITLLRLIRDNTKTEEEIGDKEARLAFLRRDTTGANQDEILRLEKELDESRLNYGDSLIDLEIQRLSDANSKAAEQREHLINIMLALLDYLKDNKEFTDEVTLLIKDGFDDAGNLIHGSELETLLKKEENWDALSEVLKNVWADNLATLTALVGAFLTTKEDEGIGKLFSNSIDAVDHVLEATLGLSENLTIKAKEAITGAATDDDVNKLFDSADKSIMDAFFGGEDSSDGGFAKQITDYWDSNNGINEEISTMIRLLIGGEDPITKQKYDGLINNLLLAINGVATSISAAFGVYLATTSYNSDNTGSGGRDTSSPKNELNPDAGFWFIVDKKGNKVSNTKFNSAEDADDILIALNKGVIPDLDRGGYIFNGTYYESENLAYHAYENLVKKYPNAYTARQFKTGGLASFTGPAWLDGTKSKPEYVLNAEQTTAFLKLADVLPQLLRAPASTITNNLTSGDIYLDLVMNVDQIADDYDVDKIADRVKEIIYDASSYRNVNVLNFIK